MRRGKGIEERGRTKGDGSAAKLNKVWSPGSLPTKFLPTVLNGKAFCSGQLCPVRIYLYCPCQVMTRIP